VNARTFHAAALAQLRGLSAEPPGRILPSKVLLLRQIANRLPKPFRFRPAADLATEIEWAKNRRIGPDGYLDAAAGHRPPIPEDLMIGVWREYERRKASEGAIDFEDLLELAIRLFDEDEEARNRFRARYRAFTVDEFQDVNLLQQTLLDRWLGDRDELCAVGDDYQSIYGFTGATPRFLLALPERFPQAAVIRLEENYRSTPQVLALANRLVPELGGSSKTLRPTRPDGPEPTVRGFPDRPAEIAGVVAAIAALAADGVRHEETAILYRVNARSEEFEEALAAARIPYQVRAGAFLARPAARQLLRCACSAGRRRRRSPATSRRRPSARAGSPSFRTASARRRRPDSSISRASSRSRASSTTARGRSRTSSPTSRGGWRAGTTRGASTCSRTTARRGSSSTRSSCRGSRRASCPPGSRRSPTRCSRRSGGSSTSA
jgi:DNA helicase-2/ATP-dependent DNA helicase PcrA